MSDHKNEGMVIITKKEYTRLINVDRWMDCLEAAGIDNTEAYSYAQELYGELDEDGELIDD